MTESILHALAMALAKWRAILWPLILGFTLSAVDSAPSLWFYALAGGAPVPVHSIGGPRQ
jgi:hypothetical protein